MQSQIFPEKFNGIAVVGRVLVDQEFLGFGSVFMISKFSRKNWARARSSPPDRVFFSFCRQDFSCFSFAT
jgi:hypothetical protein